MRKFFLRNHLKYTLLYLNLPSGNNNLAFSKSLKCLKTQAFRGFCRFHWLQLGYIERAFCSQTAQGVRASSCLATSACLFGYRWLYVSIVVCTFSCPSRSAMSRGEQPISTSRLAWLCPYGIITTNRKSPVGSRVLRFSV